MKNWVLLCQYSCSKVFILSGLWSNLGKGTNSLEESSCKIFFYLFLFMQVIRQKGGQKKTRILLAKHEFELFFFLNPLPNSKWLQFLLVAQYIESLSKECSFYKWIYKYLIKLSLGVEPKLRTILFWTNLRIEALIHVLFSMRRHLKFQLHLVNPMMCTD